MSDYSNEKLSSIILTGDQADWRALRNDLTVDLSEQIQALCSPFLDDKADLTHRYWHQYCGHFLANADLAKRLSSQPAQFNF